MPNSRARQIACKYPNPTAKPYGLTLPEVGQANSMAVVVRLSVRLTVKVRVRVRAKFDTKLGVLGLGLLSWIRLGLELGQC